MYRKKLLTAVGLALISGWVLGEGQPVLTMHRVQQRYPWNRLVDIDYTLEGVPAGSEADYYVRFKITENGRTHILHKMLDSSMLAEASNGTYRVTWDSTRESDEYHFFDKHADVKGEVVYCGLDRSSLPYGDRYVVLDLSQGSGASTYPVTYEYLDFDDATNKFNTIEYKTDKLVLREIQAGTFMMGSPASEYGRKYSGHNDTYFAEETQHQVTLTKNYFIGIFQITQKQYQNIMGTNPSKLNGNVTASNPLAARPVENVHYQHVRGSSKGIQRPATFGNTDANSFCGVLSSKTGLTFDLPTEAEWEYACRAGTTTSTYAGEMTAANAVALLSKIAWWNDNNTAANSITTSHAVGQKQPNAWGLYDTLGGMWEWCRDRVKQAGAGVTDLDNPGSEPVIDPLRDTGVGVVDRGGGIVAYDHTQCRAAIRGTDSNTTRSGNW